MGEHLRPYTVFLPTDVVERLEAYAERSGEPDHKIAADAIINRLKLIEFVERLGVRIGRRKAESDET